MCRRQNERGVALIVALLVMLIVAVLSVGLAMSTRGGERVGTGFHDQQTSFEISVAGLERARETIRENRYTNAITAPNFSSLLSTAAAGGTLVNSTSLANFGTTNGFTKDTGFTTNVAYTLPTGLDSSSYEVFLTNSARNGETVTSTTDKDDTITLTSFGSAPNSVGFSAVQAEYQPNPSFSPPLLPGLLTMPGPNVTINLPNSAANSMDGNDGQNPPNCYATVAVTTTTAKNSVIGQISKPATMHTCNPAGGSNLTGSATVDDFINGANPYNDPATNTPNLQTGSTQLTSVAYWNSLVTSIINLPADYVGTDTGSVNIGTWNSGTSTCTSPKVVVITGDFSLGGGTNGCGVLVVQGTLSMNGTPGYHGTMYVVGAGIVNRKGGGNGTINCGGMAVVNTTSPAGFPGLVGSPSYTINGGGTSDFLASCAGGLTGEILKWGVPMKRLSFQQLR